MAPCLAQRVACAGASHAYGATRHRALPALGAAGVRRAHPAVTRHRRPHVDTYRVPTVGSGDREVTCVPRASRGSGTSKSPTEATCSGAVVLARSGLSIPHTQCPPRQPRAAPCASPGVTWGLGAVEGRRSRDPAASTRLSGRVVACAPPRQCPRRARHAGCPPSEAAGRTGPRESKPTDAVSLRCEWFSSRPVRAATRDAERSARRGDRGPALLRGALSSLPFLRTPVGGAPVSVGLVCGLSPTGVPPGSRTLMSSLLCTGISALHVDFPPLIRGLHGRVPCAQGL